MSPFDRNPIVTVSIEYDCRGGRSVKSFKNQSEGRRFYMSKFKEGKNPKIVKACLIDKLQLACEGTHVQT